MGRGDVNHMAVPTQMKNRQRTRFMCRATSVFNVSRLRIKIKHESPITIRTILTFGGIPILKFPNGRFAMDSAIE